jgi:hypothetical protein
MEEKKATRRRRVPPTGRRGDRRGDTFRIGHGNPFPPVVARGFLALDGKGERASGQWRPGLQISWGPGRRGKVVETRRGGERSGGPVPFLFVYSVSCRRIRFSSGVKPAIGKGKTNPGNFASFRAELIERSQFFLHRSNFSLPSTRNHTVCHIRYNSMYKMKAEKTVHDCCW